MKNILGTEKKTNRKQKQILGVSLIGEQTQKTKKMSLYMHCTRDPMTHEL